VLPARSFSALLLKTVGSRWDSRRTSENIQPIIEAQAFLPLHDLAPPPPRSPTSPVSKLYYAATHRKTEEERQLPDWRLEGRGKEPNHTTARKSGPLYIIQYSLEDIIDQKLYTNSLTYSFLLFYINN
jgi:hypothetical protein